jgi:diguanylate cyclase (GGDEF)-like protein
MFQLPERLTHPGTSLADILAASIEAGNHAGKTADEVEAEFRASLFAGGRRRTVTYEQTLADGRIIRFTTKPIRGGAWVALHEDVSEMKRFVRQLAERELQLTLQNMRFDFTINNMPQGLCMFDGDKRLVVWNRQYTAMYNLPEDAVKRGDALDEVLRQRVAAGNRPIGGGEAFVSNRVQVVGDGSAASFVVEMEDGRVISVLHQPLADGGWVATHHDITEQRRNENRIRHLARHDALTDLPNRVQLREHLQAAEERIRHGKVMAILCVDLDHFKNVNDTLGHAIGDEVLKVVTQRLLACKREGDVIARQGGDEFAIVHGPLRRAEDAGALAARIVKSLSEPLIVDGHQILIGASVGIAVAPHDGHDADTLLKASDLACYRAKREGRGTYHFFEKSMDAAVHERRALELGLRAALSQGQLSVYYQPLYDIARSQVCGMEALLRWIHPERGLIAPSEFIPIAEETGLIVSIGEWVLRQACADAAKWPAGIKVAVNLSPLQFKKSHNLAQTVISALAAGGLEPERLELEITESVLLFEIDGVLDTLHQLRSLGVKICMDDFGTGYSSLSYLRSFPFDKIKIDRSFIQDTSARGDGTAIIKALVGLGTSLGMATTAEGVETPDQFDLVKVQGCTEVQGYLFSRPLPVGAISELLRREDIGAQVSRRRSSHNMETAPEARQTRVA